MKRFLYLFIIALAFSSCQEDVKFNNPGFQGLKDDVFWRANDARAYVDATGKLSEGNTVGGTIEVDVRPNAAERVDVHYANDGTTSLNIRIAEAFFNSNRWGDVTLGQGWTASSRVTRYTDLSNTDAISSGTSVGHLAGGTQFINKTLASADPAFGAQAANKATTSGGAKINIAEIFNDIGTLFPSMASRPRAKAISVAIGIPHP